MLDLKTSMALTADIVISHVSHNKVASGDIPGLIRSVHTALILAAKPEAAAEPEQRPAVSPRSSIKPDHLVCLEDGKQLTMLKRHLMVRFGLTPDAYRAKWNLPDNYPMVAPNYAARRREIATRTGLGKTGLGGRKKTKAPLA